MRWALLLLWFGGAALAADAPAIDWQAGARVVLAHDRFDAGVHGARSAAVGWLRRADLDLQAAAGPWRALLNLRNGGDGQWPVEEFRLGWVRDDGDAGQSAWIGRFDPDFGLEPASGSSTNPLPEASPVWDLAPHADDGSDSEGLQWRGGSGPWSGSAGLLGREGRPQLNLRVAHSRGPAGAGLSLAWRPEALDDGRLRSRLGLRGSAEHPAGRRATLAPRGDFGADLALALHATHAPAPGWRLQGELLWRHLAGHGEPDRQARGAVLQAAWTPGGAGRSLDTARGRLRAPRAEAWTWVLRASRLQVPQGGSATQWSLGSEWRWHRRSRLLAALSATRLREAPGAAAGAGHALALRWEWET